MRWQIFLTAVFYLILTTGYAKPDEKIIGKDIKIAENEPIPEETLASLPNQINQAHTISKTSTYASDKEIKDESIPKETLDSLSPDMIQNHQVRDASTEKIEVEIKDDEKFTQYGSELPVKEGNQDHNAKEPSSKEGKVVVPKEPIFTKAHDSSLTKTNSQYSKKGHILFFHNAGTRSHLIALNALAEGLVDHGHRVTSVQYMKSNIQHENYTEVLIQDK